MKTKVYCKNCRNNGYDRNGIYWPWCESLKNGYLECGSEYVGNYKKVLKTVYKDELNKNGNCKYYENNGQNNI